MLRRYYGKISKLPINEFFGHDGELVVDDITGKVYVMDGVTLGGTELVGATPRFGIDPPENPTLGALWYDPDSGRTYIYFQDTWVDAAPNTVYTLPEASDTVLGGVKVDNVSILINGSGVISANIADIKSNISLLFSNATTQASNISALFSNAAIQSANIATLISNANTQAVAIDNLISNATSQSIAINTLTANDSGLRANITAANAAIITANVGMKSYVDDAILNVQIELGASLEPILVQFDANLAVQAANANIQAIAINTLTANALSQDTQIKGLRANINSANSAIVTANVGMKSYVDSVLIANASAQESKITSLIANAATQAGLISTINANIAAANSSIANKNTLTNNGKTLTFTDGNLILPGEGNITSTSGNITVQGNIDALAFHAEQGIGVGAGFLFTDPTTGRYTSGMRHANLNNTLQLVHEGNIGLDIYSNGLSQIGNLNVKFDLNANLLNVAGLFKTAKILANIGSDNGYRFFDAETLTTTAIIHNNSTNQLQLVHENGNVALNSNGTFQTSNIILSGTTLSTQSGTLYVNGVAVGANGSTVAPSATPPVDPAAGQLWYDTVSGKIYVYLSDAWVDASPTLSSNFLINGDYTFTLDVDGNLNLPEGGDILDSNGNSVLAGNYGNAKVAAYLPTNSTIVGLISNSNIQAISINTLTANALSQDTQIKGLRANVNAANAAIITANVDMKSYVDNAVSTLTSNASTQSNQIINLTANASSQDTQITGLRANINAANAAIITANVGMKSYVDTVLTANASAQESKITSLIANSNVQAIAINTLTANALSQDTQITGLRANINAANAAIITANVGMKSYVDSITGILTANTVAQENKITLINANLASQIANADIQAIAINTLTANASSQDTQVNGLRANITAANAAIITANVAMKSYVDTITDVLAANAFTQENKITLIAANLTEQTTNAALQATTITNLTANALSQDTQIVGLRANIISANSSITTLKTQVYSNANVFAFLPTYSGSVGIDVSVSGILQMPPQTKASNATGTVGQICWDSNYIYVCTATNTWKRVALTGGY